MMARVPLALLFCAALAFSSSIACSSDDGTIEQDGGLDQDGEPGEDGWDAQDGDPGEDGGDRQDDGIGDDAPPADDGTPGALGASLVSLTRAAPAIGVSPETVYFEVRTDDPNWSSYGVTPPFADYEDYRVRGLGYYFDFDDADSGTFTTTGRSRNIQVGGSPRAIHTFECLGPADPNWVAAATRCEFRVRARVQAPDGTHEDTALMVYIESPDDHYGAADTVCVSASGDYAGCSGTGVTTVPPAGELSGKRIRLHRGETFADVCVGYQESGVLVDAYGTGPDPVVGRIKVGVDTGCNDLIPNNAKAQSYPMIAKDAHGYVTQGWAYDITVTGLRAGRAGSGMASTLVTFHKLDMDWSSDPTHNGIFAPVELGKRCVNDPDLDCANVHYSYGVFLTDSVLKGHPGNLPLVNVGCFNECGLVNGGFAGVEMKTALEHNMRFMGAWGLVVSNDWHRGGHIGGRGGKHRLALRQLVSREHSSLTVNPEDFAAGGHIRKSTSPEKWTPRYNFVLDSLWNDTVQDPNHVSASYIQLEPGHYYSAVYNNEFLADPVTSTNAEQIRIGGVHLAVRDSVYNGVSVTCRVDPPHSGGTDYYDPSRMFGDSPGSQCNANGDINAISTPGPPAN